MLGCYSDAYSFCRSNRSFMDKGIEQAISIQTIIMSQVQFLLGTNAVTPTRCFLYAIIAEVSNVSELSSSLPIIICYSRLIIVCVVARELQNQCTSDPL